MLARVFLHEWRSLTADRTLWVLAASLALAVFYAAFNGAAHLAFQERTIQTLLADQAARFDRLHADLDDYAAGRKTPTGFSDPRGASVLGGAAAAPFLILPRGPLAIVSVGQSDLYPYYFRAGMRSRQLNASTEEIENPLNLLAGRFDLAFVVLYLFPLTILALSYNLISAEKEQGTLALALSQPVSLRRIVSGKLFIRALLSIGFFTAITGFGLLLSGTNLFSGAALESWLIWMLIVAVYGLFWFSVAVAVNALGRSSSTNAVMVAGIWLAFVLLIPSVINAAASTFYPVPSRVEMIQAMRAATKEATSRRSLLLSRYMEDHPDLAPPGTVKLADFSVSTATVQMETDRLLQPVLDRFDRQSSLQQQVVDRFCFLSPAILIQSAMNDVAGSSGERQKHFLAQVDKYLSDWRAFFYPHVFAQTKFTSVDLAKAPVFHYVEEPNASVHCRVSWALGVVLLISLLTGAVALVSLRAYSVG